MKRILLSLLILATSSVFALDHLYAARAGMGFVKEIGSQVLPGTKSGLDFSLNAYGYQAMWAGGPLWGTELSISNPNLKRDTTLWDDVDGDYTDTTQYDESFGKASIALSFMKSWDFGLNISVGPQVTYQFSCTRVVGGVESNCQEDYQSFQLELQGGIIYFIYEPIGIDFKLEQTMLPYDKELTRKQFHSMVTFGILYLF